MKNRFVKCLAIFIATVMVFGVLAGCSSNKSSNEEPNDKEQTKKEQTQQEVKKLDPVELKVMLFGNQPNMMDEVLTEFEKRTKDTLNTKLNIEFSPMNDHKEKLKLRMAAGEVIDVVFDAPWMNLLSLIPQGAYIELDKYFFNDKYPGLQKAFPENFLNSNKFFDHVYGIPFTQTFMDMKGIFIKGDLRKKYGLPEVKTYDDLAAFYEKVLQNNKDLIPLLTQGSMGFDELFSPEQDKAKANIFKVVIGGTSYFSFDVALSKDNKQILGMALIMNNASPYGGDPDENYAKFPEPYNKPDTYKVEMHRKWNKYLEKDSIVQKDRSLWNAGKAASVISMVSAYNGAVLNMGPDAEFFPLFKDEREMKPGARATDYKAWNFVAIPATSKNADRTIMFFDWLFSDQANHDLFEFGIEGKHWVAEGNDKYAQPTGVNQKENYNFPGYELTWNPTMVRLSAGLPPQALKYQQYQLKDDTFFKSPLTGFNFDSGNVKTEIAKINAVLQEVYESLLHGIIDDPVGAIKKANEKAKAQGLEKIREDLRTQLQKFLDSKK